jgi:hypothetical protein
MSPFMSANKIKKPILLIHGEEDNNSGTLTMQVNGKLTFSKSAFTEEKGSNYHFFWCPWCLFIYLCINLKM